MRLTSTLLLLLATSSARADVRASNTYIGGSFELSNGLAGQSELGFALQTAPIRYLEVELGGIRHEVRGDGAAGIDFHDTWLVTSAVRAKLPGAFGALFTGVGVITGEHSNASGCEASGFINFCGDANGTFVYRHWDRAVWIKPEVGGEVALGPVALRIAIAQLIRVASPDIERGCVECDSNEPDLLFTIGLHGRVPMFN